MSEAPPFWFRPRGALARALAPLGHVYGRAAARRMAAAPVARAAVPVLCVGNLVAGGAGKTPTALALAEVAVALGLRPGFLSRGHGGTVSRPTRVTAEHTARQVGDEPLMLAERHPTVVSPDRPAGARLLAEQVDLVIMDDGFQNPHLFKDRSVLVVDARRGLGNGLVMPAGPMRAPLRAQMARAHALVVVGGGEAAAAAIRAAARAALPILRATPQPLNGADFAGRRVVAFAGIGDPEKLFASLEEVGAEIVERRPFPDHHPFRDEDCDDLLAAAERHDAVLATTEKDLARLRGMSGRQGALHEAARALRIRLVFHDEARARNIVRRTMAR